MPATALVHSIPLNGNSAPEDPVADAWARYEELKKCDDSKNGLIEELLFRYEFVTAEHRKISEEQKRDKLFYHSFSQCREAYELEIANLRTLIAQDPFILVLIDGDGMIFHETLLNDAEAGGRTAAKILYDSTIKYVGEMFELPKDFKVVARMYANLKGLADVCHKAGIVPSVAHLEEFSRGFTRGNTLFDFIDVGPGKDRADEKVCEVLKLHMNDHRCLQIIFGCSHDNGYGRLLEKYMYDKNAQSKLTLLEGVPFEKEIAALIETYQFQHEKFGELFRNQKISLLQAQAPSWVALNETALRAVNQNNTIRPAAYMRTPSDSVSSSRAPSVVANTWATKAAAAAVKPDTPPLSRIITASPSPFGSHSGTVPRNRRGQRVDPDIPRYDKPEVDRIKRTKMCNVHFLRHECPFGDGCTHRHDCKPTKQDLEWLKVVARMAACRNGSACDDVKCIYGHRCQAPGRSDKLKSSHDEGKTCIFGSDCVFPPELHNMDCNVVRYTKV